MSEQIITTPAGERLVVLPEDEYLAMREALDDRADIEAVRAFEHKLAAGEEELIPAEFVNRILDGENKVRVWRDYRGLTARDLAAAAGLSAAYVSEIETNKKDGSVAALKAIAAALRADLDDIA
ncbi:helix-turn-helix domain-containing protein [Breoghania sp. L-A4]|uniref:helix-turn-helix domain-containing protein n=1 Tax=Breoghania sp. L-A4 TaxID=2304600 RepID=UPI000E35EA6E|nr:helix-turn-helix domain-containing protein [Breoghania sp. L-A4]AXS39283.1 helix-turn-helix domain-containing protein [Breoghania sp. L-A4]